MTDSLDHAAAIVGVGAIMPDAPDAGAFWRNVTTGRYSISEVDPERWDPALYYDPDPKAHEKTYSKIGGWVRDWEWDPLAWKLPLPPKVSDGMDDAHKWALACTRMALMDAGWPDRPLDLDRTAVIIGNAISGEKHYLTAMRIMFPDLARELERTESFAALPADVRSTIERELHANLEDWLPVVTEDTMPGELGNCIAGRVANLFNLHGPNFTTDAACASALAAMDATVDGLLAHEFDVAITGGVDRNMGVHTFVKFCAIGALSPSGTRPYSEGADGFVMGEGAALFIVKRLADAVRDGDRIYAVVRGVGSASDGKGKGLTAPNPIGQRFAVKRAWRNAGLSPAECSLMEGHGTSTSVGDAVELNSLMEAFAGAQVAPGSIALGSVKSNIGHLKAAAGAAGMLKATLALHDKVLPPSINFERPNPNADWSSSPFAVNTELRDWDVAAGRSRVAGVSAFGFGGTNFHLVMEEYMPDRHATNGHRSAAVPAASPVGNGAPSSSPATPRPEPSALGKPPLRGALVLGAPDEAGLANALRTELAEARQGRHLDPTPPSSEALRSPERLAIDYADGHDLVAKAELALRVFQAGNPAAWPALRGRGIHRGSGVPGKVAFLYTGQGSQYANMLAELRRREPVVADLFEEADTLMAPLLEGRRLSDVIFADPDDPDAMARAEDELRRTEIQQPAVITVDTALTGLLGEYGIAPDMVMGHSVGEYGALVSAGALTFHNALEAVSARGREMASLRVDDPGAMAAVMAPLAEAEEIVAGVDGYVVLANINSTHQVVLGGATDAVARAVEAVKERGHTAIPLPVSHGFHTEIVAPVSAPLRAMLQRLGLSPARLPVVANVTGKLYPTGDGAVEEMLDMLSRQVASPVQFIKGLQTLYDEGARVFVEVGPKHALQGFASDVLGDDAIVSLASNHPKQGDVPTFNNALCGLWAAGLGTGRDAVPRESAELQAGATAQPHSRPVREARARLAAGDGADRLAAEPAPAAARGDESAADPVVITGAALGLPGAERLFDDANIGRLLNGEQGIDVIPGRLRRDMLDKHITRLVKGDDGGASFEAIDRLEAVIKLAARAGAFDPVEEFGIDGDRMAALGRDTQLAIAAGIDALRDAGIPLVLRYKLTTKGTKLPDRWSLPDELRDDTGIIYASAFPGLEEMADEVARYTTDHMRRERLAALETLRARMLDHDGTDPVVLDEVDRRIHDLKHELEEDPYTFDRRFIFRVLSMGHSQLAELIGARGPNTQINSACASTTQAVALAEDWIRAGRCRRVLIVAADDATSDTMMGWIGSGFLASGAAATDEVVEEAALPFDRRRHGMIIGMGAAGLMVESAAAARERGLTPICEVLGSVTANSAFHGTRLDVEHIGAVMEDLVEQGEARGISRADMAGETVFISHETYTPARGGSAAAEIHALRHVFGDNAGRIVIANVKGFTGHPMGVGLEDVLAVKALETGVVPPVPNFHDPDPELGQLNLSGGGSYPVRYSLRLAAGFGSQISLLLLRWTPVADGRRRPADGLGYEYRIADRAAWDAWLRRMTGYDAPQLEVRQHRLRVVDQGPAADKGAAPVQAQDAAPAEIEPEALEAEPATVRPEPAPVPAAAPAPEPTAPPPPEPAPQPEPTAATGGDPAERVLAIVSEETGYPPDLLDMDLDLEADLGIDTVKQAEVFAAIREAYGIPFDDSLKLRDYPTLNHVVGFVNERSAAPTPPPAPEPTAPPPPEPAPQPEPTAATGGDPAERVLAIVSEETGYPPDLLDMDLDLEADLGIDTVKQAEVFAAIREAYGIPFDDSLKLRDYPTLNHVVGFVNERSAAPTPPPAPEPTAPPPPEPAPQPEPTAATGGDPAERVLAIVSEETGYPPDLLDMDLDLEADLGIDTVKQAEVFAAIREAYGIPFDDSLKLRDYPTLNHVVGFVNERSAAPTPPPAPEPTAPPPPEPAPQPEPTAATGGDPAERVLAIVSEETGYPPDLLDMDLDLEADLGIDTVKQAEVFAAIREAYGIPFDDSLKLRDYPTLNHVVGFVNERSAAPTPPPAPEPTAPPPPEPAPQPEPTAATGGDPAERVLAIVSEETGYPPDLLDMDLDLEADLGIDTVKQAEVFAAIREAYGIPFDDSLKLRDYPTLNHVVGFVNERSAAPTPPPAPEPTAPPPPEPAPQPEPTAATGGDPAERVLAIVSEETGYPPDLLDMDLDLEADLGIDTVKQAEVFAAIREAYGIPFDDSLKLRDYPTLNHVVGFVNERSAAPTPPPAPEPAAAPGPSEPGTVEFPRRVPVPVVRPALEHCASTGVSLEAGTRVILMPDTGGVGPALASRLQKRGVEVLGIDGAPDASELERQISDWKAAGPVHGVYWLPALDPEGPLTSLDAGDWSEGLRLRVKLLAVAMRALAEDVGAPGTFLVSGSRLGGRHGYDSAGATSVMGGAVTGFTKSLARERPDALVKAVDFPPSRKTSALADLLIEEALRDPEPIEVGHADDLRWSVGLNERIAQPDPARAPDADTVFCVTGAAGSIVAAITADLAAASGATFHLLDLVPEPDPGDPDLARFVSDRDGLKRELAARIKEGGERPTPKLVERALARIERARAALDAIEAIRNAGGSPHWHQVDITDAAQVSAAIASALEVSGRIDVLVHCAGLEISHFLPDKPQSEFDLVFDVKVNGWFNLLTALGDAVPRTAVVFSSIAGRLGNAGQTDYAAANDLMCKSVSALRGGGEVRGVAIDWTAWAGIGMASRGSIPKMMEMAGIDMLPPEQGVPVVRREITATDAGAEVLVAGSLGVLLEERHPTGGLDPDAATQALVSLHGPMTGRATGFSSGRGLTVLTELDPTRQPFLNDHRIEGTAVLPGVMGIEGFAEAASALAPGWHVTAFEDVELMAPFKFYRDEPRTIELQVLPHDGGDGTLVADCRLVGRRTLPQGEQEAIHFTGRAIMTRELPEPPVDQEAPSGIPVETSVGAEAIYGIYFHGPAYRVLERAWRDDGVVVGQLAPDLPPDHEPADEPTELAPRLIELCFQTAGVWELGTEGRMALPTHVDRVSCFAGADAPGELVAIVHPREDGSGTDARVVDQRGRARVILEGYRTIELPGGLDDDALAPIRSAIG